MNKFYYSDIITKGLNVQFIPRINIQREGVVCRNNLKFYQPTTRYIIFDKIVVSFFYVH